MAVSVRLERLWPERLYATLCGVLSLYCLWAAFKEWRDREGGVVLFLCVIALLLIGTALSVTRESRVAGWLSLGSGAALALYGLIVTTFGWEDVGGARGALAIAIGVGSVGLLGVVVGIRHMVGRR